MRNSFKKLIAVTLAFLMVVATLVVPNLTAKAEGNEGYVTMANDFDWSGLGDYSNIYVYANWDDTLTPESSLRLLMPHMRPCIAAAIMLLPLLQMLRIASVMLPDMHRSLRTLFALSPMQDLCSKMPLSALRI